MIDIYTTNSPARDAAKALTREIKANKNKDILLLFSGGSSLAIVDHIDPSVIPKDTTVSVFDERYTLQRNESNFSKLLRTSFSKYLLKRGIPYIDPQPQQEESLDDTAKRFDLALKHWHVLHDDGVVLATVGIGSDGHTAGILPLLKKRDQFERLFLGKNSCAVGYEIAPEVNPHTKRITTTLTYIERHLTYACIYAIGNGKKEVLKELIAREHEVENMPAEILKRVPKAELFTDLSL